MLKKSSHIIVGLLLLSACVHDYELKPIDPAFVFHCNASKVWVINHLYKDHKDFAPLSLKYKEMIIFHKNGNCFFYQVNQFQNGHSRKADFEINQANDQITFSFNKDKWVYKVKSYSVDKIILAPIKAAKFNYTIELIPFPEF